MYWITECHLQNINIYRINYYAKETAKNKEALSLIQRFQ